jgi:hypothetical protein
MYPDSANYLVSSNTRNGEASPRARESVRKGFLRLAYDKDKQLIDTGWEHATDCDGLTIMRFEWTMGTGLYKRPFLMHCVTRVVAPEGTASNQSSVVPSSNPDKPEPGK